MVNEPLESEEMVDSSDDFEAAYESHAKAIYKFLFWRTRDAQLSEDLTSSTFEKAWISRGSFRGGSVQAWLYRIARNVLIDHWRKKQPLYVEDTDLLYLDTQPTAAEVLDKKQQLKELQRALDTLPDGMRQIVMMRFIEGYSCKQVAETLSMSESNVRVIQYRALKKLKERLK
jgi:RNA polymerase sigma-70 factor (ECF subfamily)